MMHKRLMQDMSVLRLVQIALSEDVGTGDLTSEGTIPAELRGRGEVRMKTDGVLAGTVVAEIVLAEIDRELTVDWAAADGDRVPAGTIVGTIFGPLRGMMTAERTMLNFMQRMSGVATLTRRFVDAIAGTRSSIIDTRKTIPGWRLLDKYSVATGGGANHRMGLYDMAMIKDNHIAAAGSITAAVDRLRAFLDTDSGTCPAIEVETQTIEQVKEVLRCPGVTRIMFDNFPVPRLREGVDIVAGRIETEASGGVDLSTVRTIAETGVDFISVGALTHSAIAADISLDVVMAA